MLKEKHITNDLLEFLLAGVGKRVNRQDVSVSKGFPACCARVWPLSGVGPAKNQII